MTEQPDTTEIRALMDKYDPPLSPMLIWTLCDALDAARTKHDAASTRATSAEIGQAHFRALWEGDRARAETAEARIANALVMLDASDHEDTADQNSTWPNPVLWGYTRTADIRRALTGGTDQGTADLPRYGDSL